MGLFDKLFGKGEKVNDNHIYAPLTGKVVPISEVPDPTFAEGMLGNGIAIIPTDGKVYAPCNGKVETMFSTGHAVALSTAGGAELLIHVGLETVGLNGGPFTIHVKNEQKVKKGDLIAEFDINEIKKQYRMFTPILVTNADDFASVEILKAEGDVKVGEPLYTVKA